VEHPDRPILLLDGHTRTALAACRALDADGFKVVVGSPVSGSLAAASKYCQSELVYPDPFERPSEFRAWLVEQIGQTGFSALLPVSDITAWVVAHASEPEIRRLAVVAEPGSFALAVDKWGVLQAASRAGIEGPPSKLCRHVAELADAAIEFGWPLVMKPRRSIEQMNESFTRRQVHVATDTADMEAAAAWMLEEGEVIAQKFLEGGGIGCFVFFDRGRHIASFAHRRLREKPPAGGVSVLSESIAADPALMSRVIAMFESLNWHGIAMAEFRQGPAGVHLMEINGRLWGSLQLSVSAGLNFPAALVRSHLGMPLHRSTEYRIGVRNRWLLGDLDNLLIQCFRSRPPLRMRDKLSAVRVFLMSSWRNSSLEVFDLRDIRPFLREVRLYLRDILSSGGNDG